MNKVTNSFFLTNTTTITRIFPSYPYIPPHQSHETPPVPAPVPTAPAPVSPVRHCRAALLLPSLLVAELAMDLKKKKRYYQPKMNKVINFVILTTPTTITLFSHIFSLYSFLLVP